MKNNIKIKPMIVKPEKKEAQRPTVVKGWSDVSQSDRDRKLAEIREINYRKKHGPLPEKKYEGESLTKNISQLGDAKRSDTVFIIGGGPSLIGFDFNTLRGKDTIVVNKAVDFVPNPNYFITMDYTYMSKTEKLISTYSNSGISTVFVVNKAGSVSKNNMGEYVDTKFNLKYTRLNEFNYLIESSHIIHPSTGFGKSLSHFAHGDNSGFCAIQLALILGYEKIYLLGMDLTLTNHETKSHFHDAYRGQSSIKRKIMSYYENIKYALRLTKESEKIISCSSISRLNELIKYENYNDIAVPEIVDNNKETVIDDMTEQNNMHDLVVVGYYTVNTPYQTEAQKLIASCKKLGLNHDIIGVDNLGNWQANTRYKAKFMGDMLLKHPGKKLLYVDCDAVIHRLPTLFMNYSADIAVRFQDFRWRKNECLSGTIYMENNLKTRKLCEIWGKINKSEGPSAKTFEQWNLGAAIEQMSKTDNLVCKNLPAEYTFIFDSMRKMYPNAVPVIEHFQASRKYKNKV